MADPTDPNHLGTFIRMKALPPAQLPHHPDLASLQSGGSPHELGDFVHAILEEGQQFMTGYLPKHFKVKDTHKHSPPSKATVELLHHQISAHDLPQEGRTQGRSESWYARSSIHENAAKHGTASWEEFDAGLRKDHSQHEKDYTPDVEDAHKVLDWRDELQRFGHAVGQWTDVEMYLMEMVHNLPFPLQTRVFTVLVLAGKKGHTEFVDVQIPVDMSKVPNAKYAKDSKYTPGIYCSIERGELLEDGAKVKWQMGTASDAGGNLPMWVQKLGIGGAVVKDVGLFMEWRDKERKGKA
ncbi:hypothetical protein M409DRAFT_69536 [Zasmidium cellare ATCC 36951]|uniref:DUF3074 domain-containing protein n=1 Tax=Zasmidium cellare ATCC 36951 TaxID=1080233 RepID=A0A6A6C3X5_ZASCE|nr:uncharacterized protein M409DRAFT_69536 [Zasmidium cellare ATCC 36951]KAF2161725.1 hypothetical protein M409DRAFT_69536 [Zasmidium cellare ATCC 36951]